MFLLISESTYNALACLKRPQFLGNKGHIAEQRALPWKFFTFLNFMSDTKLRKVSQLLTTPVTLTSQCQEWWLFYSFDVAIFNWYYFWYSQKQQLFKRESPAQVFLMNFAKFLKHLFCETSANGCLCIPEVRPSPFKKVGFIGPLTISRNSSILPSILLSFRAFSCYFVIVFAKFWHGARNPYKVVHDSQIFGKNFLPQKSRKSSFFNSLNNLVINFY